MDLPHGKSIPVLFAKGTHYEVGYQVGSVFQKRIKEYFVEFQELYSKFIPFYNTPMGKQVCNGFLDTVKETLPQYLEEVKGIADGSGIPFHEVFLMHIRVELQTYMAVEVVPECSTLFVNHKDNWLLAHNEDTSVAAFDKGYILVASIYESESSDKRSHTTTTHENVMAFCYPGIIPGNSFSCNSHGMVLTMNALYSDKMEINNMPRQFVNRVMLTATNPDHLMEILNDGAHRIATGCSVNMALADDSSDQQRMANIELCPQVNATLIDKIDIPIQYGSFSGNYAHFNMYDHMTVAEMKGRTVSSQHRKATVNKMPLPHDLQSVTNILGDQSDEEYPLFRTPRKTDSGSTVATGVFDLKRRRLLVYLGNPINKSPVVDIAFPSV